MHLHRYSDCFNKVSSLASKVRNFDQIFNDLENWVLAFDCSVNLSLFRNELLF